MSDESLPKGFVCRCGKRNKFNHYVYAHWDIKLEFDCPGCGKWKILRGEVRNQYVKAEPFFAEINQ